MAAIIERLEKRGWTVFFSQSDYVHMERGFCLITVAADGRVYRYGDY